MQGSRELLRIVGVEVEDVEQRCIKQDELQFAVGECLHIECRETNEWSIVYVRAKAVTLS